MSKTEKRCSSCTETKPLAEFYKMRSQPDGTDAYCKPCRREASREYNKANPEYQRNYYQNVVKPKRKAEREALERLRELDPTWEPSA